MKSKSLICGKLTGAIQQCTPCCSSTVVHLFRRASLPSFSFFYSASFYISLLLLIFLPQRCFIFIHCGRNKMSFSVRVFVPFAQNLHPMPTPCPVCSVPYPVCGGPCPMCGVLCPMCGAFLCPMWVSYVLCVALSCPVCGVLCPVCGAVLCPESYVLCPALFCPARYLSQAGAG